MNWKAFIITFMIFVLIITISIWASISDTFAKIYFCFFIIAMCLVLYTLFYFMIDVFLRIRGDKKK